MERYFMETHHHEWVLSNRLGGYALGTGNLINQRKYHGLLIAAKENLYRENLVAGIEEKIEWRGEVMHLDSNNYSNCIYPEGFLHLVKPWLRPYPIFLYSALPHRDEILILKEIMMDEETNTTLVRYTNLGQHRLHFEFHPKYAMCNHHQLNEHGAFEFLDFEKEIVENDDFTHFTAKRTDTGVAVSGVVFKGKVSQNRYVYHNVYYPWEVMLGYAGIGDQISLFQLNFDLAVGESNTILFSDLPINEPHKVAERISERYKPLPLPADYPLKNADKESLLATLDYEDENLFDHAEYMQLLEWSLKDFALKDNIIAGIPFYGIYSRDTMFMLYALLQNKDNMDYVERILGNYSRKIKGGLIPTAFDEHTGEPVYKGVGETLWYIVLLYFLAHQKAEPTFFKEMIGLIENILLSILENENYPFFIRKDGLIELKKEWADSTWMNATLDGVPITPRDGAPVELNFLWYNAFMCYLNLCEYYNTLMPKQCELNHQLFKLSAKIEKSLVKYCTDDAYLADRLVGDEPIVEIRPNAIIALSLPWHPYGLEVLKGVFERAFSELYTFYGIRTLSPDDYRFKKKYYGHESERNLAYHNGAVWAWLLQPFCKLYRDVYKGEKSCQEVSKAISLYIGVLRNGYIKGHIASVAEIWDGDMPHFPKGAPARAMSVAALYLVEKMLECVGEDK